jgi:hypothetical protein
MRAEDIAVRKARVYVEDALGSQRLPGPAVVEVVDAIRVDGGAKSELNPQKRRCDFKARVHGALQPGYGFSRSMALIEATNQPVLRRRGRDEKPPLESTA